MIKQNFYIDQTLEHTHLNKLQTDIETIIEENISFIVKDGIVSKDIQLVDKKLKISNFLGYKNGKKLSITSDEIDISPFTSTETKVLSIFVLPKEIYSTPIVDGKNQTILYNKEDSYQFNIFFETTPHGLIDIGTLLCDLYITESNIDKIDLSRVRKIQSFDNFFVGSKIPETKSLDEITRAGTYFGWYDSIESKPTLNYMTQKAPVAWQFRLSVFLIESRLYQLFYSFAGEIFYRYTDSNNFFLNWIDYSPKNMLNKNNNLSDLYNISIARNNISVYSRVETDNKDLTTLNSAKLYADKGIFLTGNDDLNTIKTPGNYRGYSNNTTTNHSPALYNFYLTVYYNDKRDGGDFFTQEIIFNNGNKYTRSSDNLGNFSTDSTINFGWLRTANINDVTTAVTTSNNYTDLQINSHDSKHFGAFYQKSETYNRTDIDNKNTNAVTTSNNYTDLQINSHDSKHFGAFYQKSETYNRTDIDNKDLTTLNSAKLYADKGIFLIGNDDLNTIKTPGNYRGYSNNTTTNHSPALYNFYLTVYYNDKRDGGDYITQEIIFNNGNKYTRYSDNLGNFSTDSIINFGWLRTANINDVTTAVTTSNNYTDLQINSHDSKHFGAFYQKSETYNRTDIDNKDLSTLNSAKLYADKGIFLTGNDDLNTIKTPGNYRGYSNNTTTNHSPALYNYYLTVYYNDKRDGGDYITQEITFDNGSKHTRVSNNLGVFSTDSASNFGWEKVAKETFVDAKINDNILVGEIKILAGIPSNISNKYLLCDGSAVKRTDYPDLFSVISITWGAGDSITTFNLPDLRGMFLRGSGSQTIFSKVYNGGNIGDPSKDFASVEKDGDNDFQDYSTGDRIYAITSLKQGGGETKPVSKTVAYYIKAKK